MEQRDGGCAQREGLHPPGIRPAPPHPPAHHHGRKDIHWIDVRVEVSPFIVDGEYCGAIARYAPDAQGLILSPPPADMGMTIVQSG